MKIPLSQGKIAEIDDSDFHLISRYRWHAVRGKNGDWYARSNYRSPKGHWTVVYMARMILGLQDDKTVDVDHKNHDTLNNRRQNLRVCSPTQNMGNRRFRIHSSKYKGVTLIKKTGKWQAQIQYNHVNYRLGLFLREEDARDAYDIAAVKFFGEFALTNVH